MDGAALAAGLGIDLHRIAQLVRDPKKIHHHPPGFSPKTRFTRAMACIRLWPASGLSRYMVCIGGQSKPVSHMSHTIARRRSSSGSLNRRASASRRALVLACRATRSPSAAEPVMTTLTKPASSSSACQSGRNATISSYRSMQMARLMQTAMALPSITSRRFSKCSTISLATSFRRSLAPTSSCSGTSMSAGTPRPSLSASAAALSCRSASAMPASSGSSFTSRIS